MKLQQEKDGKKKKLPGECKIRGTLVERKGRKRSNVKTCEESKEIKMNKTVPW